MADLKDMCLRFYKEVFENRDLAALDHLLTEDAVDHEQGPPGVEIPAGREGVKRLIGAYLDAFNPMTVDVHAQYQEGDTVITRATFHGTHSGAFGGVAPTRKRISVEAIDIVRFEGDRMAEHWGQTDGIGMLAQLGVLPPMG